MNSIEILRSEVSHYLILADTLRERYGEIDDGNMKDTLEGISALPEAIEAIVRSSLEDEDLVSALKGRLGDLQARLDRFRDRHEKKRSLARWAMVEADLDKIVAADFSVSLRKGGDKLEVIDETRVAQGFFVPQPAKLDRKGLVDALKRAEMVDGALLVTGEPSITVRVR